MEREIKFRGKTAEGTWVFGNLEIFDNYVRIGYYNLTPGGNKIYTYEKVHADTVGQFTGLSDINGISIYEGDIVKKRYYPIGSPKGVEYYNTGIIVYNYKGFGNELKIEGVNILDTENKQSHHKQERERYRHPTCGYDWIDDHTSFRSLEVIGNKSDNPELVTV